MRPTMTDVAAAAGVGLGTVSRVVNGDPAVSPAMRERVQAAIDATRYRRNELARSIRPGQTSTTLALLLGDLTNPFYARMAKAAVAVAGEAGYAVLLSTADEDPAAEQRAVTELVGRRVGGLMIVPDQGDHAYLAPEVELGTPVVFLDRPATGIEADVVMIDNERGAADAARHLIAHGHHRIGVVVAPSYYTTGRRLRGFRRALREAGDRLDDSLVRHLDVGSAEASAAAVADLLALPDPPTAIFATTGFLSQGAVLAMRGREHEVALVGFDDFPLAELLPVPVTVVAGDAAAMGERAVRLLLARIAGGTGPAHRAVLPTQLITRGSGEIHA